MRIVLGRLCFPPWGRLVTNWSITVDSNELKWSRTLRPGGGTGYGFARNLSQLLQVPLIFFTRRRSLSTQYFPRTFVIVRPTPPWRVVR